MQVRRLWLPPAHFTSLEKVLEWISLAGLIFSLVSLARAWNQLPDYFPVHFDFMGRPNGWGGRRTMLILPIMSLSLYLLLAGIRLFKKNIQLPQWIRKPELDPAIHATQDRIAKEILGWVKAEILWIYAITQYQMLDVALGARKGLNPFLVPVITLILLATIGGYLWRAMRLRRVSPESVR